MQERLAVRVVRLARLGRSPRRPLAQELPQLAGIEHRELRHGPLRVRRRGREQGRQVFQHPLRGGLFEQGRVVLEARHQLPVLLGHEESEVELGAALRQPDRFESEGAEPQRRARATEGEGRQAPHPGHRALLEREHGLEERRSAPVPARGQLLRQEGEWVALVGEGRGGLVAHPIEELAEGGVAGEVRPHRHRVDEVAHQAGELGGAPPQGADAPRGGRAHGEGVLPGVAPEQRLEPGEERGEERRPAGAGQGLERPAQVPVRPVPGLAAQEPRHDGALGRRRRRPGPVRRQVEHGHSAGEALAPEAPEARPLLPGERLRLARRPLGVGEGQSGQAGSGGPPRRQLAVDLPRLAEQEGERPEVADRVVERDEEHRPAGGVGGQHHAEGRAALQVDRPEGELGEALRQLRRAPPGGVDLLEEAGLDRTHPLHRRAVLDREQGPQGRVALDDLAEAPAQQLRVHRTQDPAGAGDSVGGARRGAPVEEPEGLLAVAEGQGRPETRLAGAHPSAPAIAATGDSAPRARRARSERAMSPARTGSSDSTVSLMPWVDSQYPCR